MILSKTDLKYYLSEDLKRFEGRKPTLKDWLVKMKVGIYGIIFMLLDM